MPIVTGAVSAGELSFRALDCPLIVANNVLERYNILPQWRRAASHVVGTSGSWTGTDVSTSTYPVSNAFDRRTNLFTAPQYTGGTFHYYLMLDLIAGTAERDAVDCVAIINHNFRNLATPYTIRLQISDDPTFAAGIITLATWTNTDVQAATGASRLVLTSGTARYTSVRYGRLWFETTNAGGWGAGSSFFPQLGELILGRRRQLVGQPTGPYAYVAGSQHSEVVEFMPDSGHAISYVRRRGQAIISPTFESGGLVEAQAGVNQETTLLAMWRECAQGSKPVLYQERPATSPLTAHLMRFSPPDLAFEADGGWARTVTLDMAEMPPFVALEEAA